MNRLLMGSVAEETIRKSSLPVLLVRATEEISDISFKRKNFPYQNIVLATDGSKTSHLALIQAIYLSKALQGNLTIIHVARKFSKKDLPRASHSQETIEDPGEIILEKAKQICLQNHAHAKTMLIEINDEHESFSEKIIETINSVNADLLIIGTHGRSGINRLILGSVAEETVRKSPIPVLLIRPDV